MGITGCIALCLRISHIGTSPTQAVGTSPTQAGHASPTPAGDARVLRIGTSPAQAVETSPSQAGHASPTQAGDASPTPAFACVPMPNPGTTPHSHWSECNMQCIGR